MKKLAFINFIILIAHVSFSQSNYLPGYVISLSGDTLSGFVDYRNWSKNPDEIQFKNQLDGEAIHYTPTDVIEFKVKNEIYVSGIIDASISPIQTNLLETGPSPHIRVDTTFLQTLILGNKSLYHYKTPEGLDNFYIMKQDSTFDLLVYKKYLVEGGEQASHENKRYLGQLALYLTDCPAIHTKFSTTSYRDNSLVNLFRYYYENTKQEIRFQKRKEKITTQIGFLAGASITTLEFASGSFKDIVNATYEPSLDFSTGVFFEFVFPRNQGKWSVCTEMLYSSYTAKGTYKEIESVNIYSNTTIEIGYSYLKVNALLRFKYPIGKTYLFFNGGLSRGAAISSTNSKREEWTFYSSNGVDEEVAVGGARNNERGYILGTGLKFNQFSVEARYEKGNGMSSYVGLESITRRYFILIGYRLR